MTLKYEITEGRTLVKSTRHRGYRMSKAIGPFARRKIRQDEYEPNGIFYGYVFSEREVSHTGDWGDGVETKTSMHKDYLAKIEPAPDRELVERRTKAVWEALNALEA